VSTAPSKPLTRRQKDVRNRASRKRNLSGNLTEGEDQPFPVPSPTEGQSNSAESPVQQGKPSGGEPAPPATPRTRAKTPRAPGAVNRGGRPKNPDKVPQHMRALALSLTRKVDTTDAILDCLAVSARYLLRGELDTTVANSITNILSLALRAIESKGTVAPRGTLVVKLKAKASGIGGGTHAAPPKPQTPDEALALTKRRLVVEPGDVPTATAAGPPASASPPNPTAGPAAPPPADVHDDDRDGATEDTAGDTVTERTTTLKFENLTPEQMTAALAGQAPAAADAQPEQVPLVVPEPADAPAEPEREGTVKP